MSQPKITVQMPLFPQPALGDSATPAAGDAAKNGINQSAAHSAPIWKEEWGTFKDSLGAPVHSWFTYPAGFSYKAVTAALKRFGIAPGDVVYDPFAGSGTTLVVAKTAGIHSVGVEAHPFVYRIAQAKLCWDVPQRQVIEVIETVNRRLKAYAATQALVDNLEAEFPALILKCYQRKTLADLWALRDLVMAQPVEPATREFFFVVITALLRTVSSAATGWPYIAPRKQKVTALDKDVLTEFIQLATRMYNDLVKIKQHAAPGYAAATHLLVNQSSEETRNILAAASVDHVFTSPPYLNNFDYADRTRLELYFWGEAQSWGDISEQVRARLMTSATTQVTRSDDRYTLSAEFRTACPQPYAFVADAVQQLSERRKSKRGKKSYDAMVAGYFNDIFKILRDVRRVIKPGRTAVFVLGDSAPYGVHIPTDRLIGEIGVALGFEAFVIEVLRTRGDKWKANPQRHNVALRESVVLLSS